jgi:hypothetical protein
MFSSPTACSSAFRSAGRPVLNRLQNAFDLFGECEIRLEEDKAVLRFKAFPSAVLRARADNTLVADFGEGTSGRTAVPTIFCSS